MDVLVAFAARTPEWWHISGPAMDSVLRLFVAALLGGAIGLERELKHRPSGLRTNILICFGSAMFTLLSYRLVGAFSSGADPTRIAAQIIPGIGFIGAGSILRDKVGVSGLTSAATIFVVAGIGMAAGAGLYQTAFFSTILVLVCLLVLGRVETLYDLKPVVVSYDVISTQCESADPIIAALNHILDELGTSMQTVRILSGGDHQCHVQFSVEAFRSQQRELANKVKSVPIFTTVASTSLGQRE